MRGDASPERVSRAAVVIRNLTAQAWLAEPGAELDGARQRAAAGDPDWALWVAEFDRGEATLIDMRVSITIELDDTSIETIAVENHQVWMHVAQHPPIVAALIADISSKDLDYFAGHLHELGGQITEHELAEMYVEVELGDSLLDALRPSDRHARRSQPAVRRGPETEPA